LLKRFQLIASPMVNFGLPSFIHSFIYLPDRNCLPCAQRRGPVSVGWKRTDTIPVLMDTGDRQILLIIEIIGIMIDAVKEGL